MNARDLMWEWLAYGKSAASLPKDSPLEAFFADKVVPLLATPLHERALAACKAMALSRSGPVPGPWPNEYGCAAVGREALAAEKPILRWCVDLDSYGHGAVTENDNLRAIFHGPNAHIAAINYAAQKNAEVMK